jgi:hypothetical protein
MSKEASVAFEVLVPPSSTAPRRLVTQALGLRSVDSRFARGGRWGRGSKFLSAFREAAQPPISSGLRGSSASGGGGEGTGVSSQQVEVVPRESSSPAEFIARHSIFRSEELCAWYRETGRGHEAQVQRLLEYHVRTEKLCW